MRRSLIMLVSLLLAATAAGCGKKEAPPPPVTEVKAAVVLQKDVPIYVEAIGQTRGSTEIEVRARVEGFVESVDFNEGSLVRKGQLLYRLDPRPFEASLAQAKGTLAEAQAQYERTRQDVIRYEPLVAKNAISRQEYETAVAQQNAAEAGVEAARAAAEGAQIDLGYTRVLAPETGLIGRTEVYPGTLVGRGQSTLMTRISQIESIHVRFTLTERDYLYYAKTRPGASWQQRAGSPAAARDGPRRRLRASAPGPDRVRGSQRGPDDRHDHAGGCVPQPRRDRAAGAVCPHPGGGGAEEGGDPGPPARGLRAAGDLQRRGGQGRRHHRHPDGADRPAGRHPVGHRLGAQGRRADRGRGAPEGPAGNEGESPRR